MPEQRMVPGEVVQLDIGLRRILAQNPSPMTAQGTNTYLLGEGTVTVIDPGPAIPAHLAAIRAALAPGERIGRILVTHTHADHSGLAPALAGAARAPTLGFGPAEAGRSQIMTALAAAGDLGGGEGLDRAFVPDIPLRDGAVIDTPAGRIEAIHTPGHLGNHLCFAWEGHCFTGDLVMGWSSSIVSPPDGDMTDYMASLRRLAARPWHTFHAGHGQPIGDPARRLSELIVHRETREAEILALLALGPATVAALTARIYGGQPPATLEAAKRNVFAHLIDLASRNLVRADPATGFHALFLRL